MGISNGYFSDRWQHIGIMAEIYNDALILYYYMPNLLNFYRCSSQSPFYLHGCRWRNSTSCYSWSFPDSVNVTDLCPSCLPTGTFGLFCIQVLIIRIISNQSLSYAVSSSRRLFLHDELYWPYSRPSSEPYPSLLNPLIESSLITSSLDNRSPRVFRRFGLFERYCRSYWPAGRPSGYAG